MAAVQGKESLVLTWKTLEKQETMGNHGKIMEKTWQIMDRPGTSWNNHGKPWKKPRPSWKHGLIVRKNLDENPTKPEEFVERACALHQESRTVGKALDGPQGRRCCALSFGFWFVLKGASKQETAASEKRQQAQEGGGEHGGESSTKGGETRGRENSIND